MKIGHYFPHLRIPVLRELAFRRDPLRFLSSLAEKHGDFCEFFLGGRRFFLVNQPELARELLVTNHHKFHKGPGLQRAKRLLGEGLLTSEGDYHRRQRHLIQPAFRRQQVADHAQAITQCAQQQQESWLDGAELDISREMKRLTLAVLGDTILGTDVRREAEEIGDALDEMIHLSLPSFGLGLIRKALPKRLGLSEDHFPQLRERTDEIISQIIARRRAAGGGGSDLLSTLLRLRDEEGALTDEQVRDEVMTLVQAGHETVANALTWLWVLLARHPDAERRLHEELETVLGMRSPTIEDIGRLDFTNAVLTETLRLYPSAWVIGRYAMEDAELNGHKVPRGSVVFVSPYLLHRRPEMFERPLEFYPERWLSDGREAPAFLPFGMGPRRCVGENFAVLEMLLIVAMLARNWRFDLAPGAHVELDARITLRTKRGVRVVAHQRLPAMNADQPA